MGTTVLSTYDDVREALRHRELRQALYDEGAALMTGVIVNLHGDEHRARRRLENRLFRRDVFSYYERRVLTQTMEEALKPYLAEGGADLLPLARRAMMTLAARIAGVDLPLGTTEEFDALYALMGELTRASTVVHHRGDDKAAVVDAGLRALAAFDERFLRPSVARRRGLLAQFRAGELAEDDLPKDVLTTLLRAQETHGLDDEVVLREVAYFPWVGSHSTSHAFVHALDEVFRWGAAHPDDDALVRRDRTFLQRCVHEALRLHPASPEARRRALADVRLRSGAVVPEGDLVVLRLVDANRDPGVFGDGAERFDPRRPLPADVSPWGLTFGHGMHSCLGQELAGGLAPEPGVGEEEHLFGTIVAMAKALLAHGARPDPERPPRPDLASSRPNFASYPVVFAAP